MADITSHLANPRDIIIFCGQDWWYHNRAHSDFQLMTRAGGEELARARAWLEDWIAAEPGYLMPRRLLEAVAREYGWPAR